MKRELFLKRSIPSEFVPLILLVPVSPLTFLRMYLPKILTVSYFCFCCLEQLETMIFYKWNIWITDSSVPYITAGSPTLDFQTKDLVVVEGEKMHLPIPFRAVPSPKITWHKDGNEMKADDRTFFRAEYTSCHLEVPSCLHADAGQYKVTLENRNGSTSGTINVKVIGMF